MPTPTVLITGSSGLVGSEAVTWYDRRGWRVVGLDNGMRREFLGPEADVGWNLARLRETTQNFEPLEVDIRHREAVFDAVRRQRPQAVIHCAAQPAHDVAKDKTFEDFETNALGTLNLLEACRHHAPEAPLAVMSTNKVYGDAVNELPLVETPTRWEYARPEDWAGVSERMRIDQSLHSLFGVSKTAADLLTQEYGRYFGMPTACFRAGCLTGGRHSGAPLHGFLSYLVKAAAAGQTYTIHGYQGKQVRDQLHGADVASAIDAFIQSPRSGEVYNLGGGRDANASILELVDLLRERYGCQLNTVYSDTPRVGDHICYISDCSKLRSHYPAWRPSRTLAEMVDEIWQGWQAPGRLGF